jgi:uncharacterized hydrophobic protein (TIGR00271 family)
MGLFAAALRTVSYTQYMKILEGGLPEGKLWRALVLLSPQHEPGLAWQLGLQLADGNHGDIVAAIILPLQERAAQVEAARAVFSQARRLADADSNVYAVLGEAADMGQALESVVAEADIDLVIADGERPEWQALERSPVPVMVIRGAAYMEFHQQREGGGAELPPVRRILIPTVGGPNTAVALSMLLPLAPEVELTTLYVVRSYLGEEEEAHGRGRLRQLAQFVDGTDRLERKVLRAPSPTDGIIAEASGDYDLVVLGATRENTLARALFGDVVGSVVRESRTPVVVVREGKRPIGIAGRNLAWRLQRVFPRLDLNARTEVYTRVRRSARPDTDFFVLIGLSALIAALGLMLNSAAVVIGAMLVAPLMSPMVGAGLAIVLGNVRFLRLSVEAIMRGALLAIIVSILLGLIWPNTTLTSEILARTEPTLLDLGVALFAGMAGAYALAHSQAAAALPGVAISAALVPPLSTIGISLAKRAFPEALGATLLFTTNLIAIIAAAVLVFVVLGFRPAHGRKGARAVQQRTVQIAVALLALITLLLGVTTVQLARESRLSNRLSSVTEERVEAINGVEFDALSVENLGDSSQPLLLDVTVRSTYPIPNAQVEALRDEIAQEMAPFLEEGRELALTLTVIRVTRLDPAALPTEGAPPVGGSAAIVDAVDGVSLYEAPGFDARALTYLAPGASLLVLEGQATVNGERWQRVASGGRVGWVPANTLGQADEN